MSLETLERKAKEKEKKYHIDAGDYKCNDCNSDVLCVSVIFSIHDSGFSMAGSGKTTRQNYPYCPQCEEKPEIRGLPIKV